MKKIWLLIIGIVLIICVIYYFGIYTYFIKTEIHEELPTQTAPASDSFVSDVKIIAMGSFGEVDFIHKGSGQANLVEIGGKKILRLENFKVTSGPDLYVYLSDSKNPTNDIKDLGNYISLGLLKATSGDQNYEAPADAKDYKTVVIWCKRFGVLFSFAVIE